MYRYARPSNGLVECLLPTVEPRRGPKRTQVVRCGHLLEFRSQPGGQGGVHCVDRRWIVAFDECCGHTRIKHRRADRGRQSFISTHHPGTLRPRSVGQSSLSGEEGVFGGIGGEFECPVVGLDGLIASPGADQQVGPGGVEGLVVR